LSLRRFFHIAVLIVVALVCAQGFVVRAVAARPDTGDYEGRPIAAVEIVLDGAPPDATAEAELLSLLRIATGTEYTAVRVRDSLQALYDSGLVASARVEVREAAASASSSANRASLPVRVRFIVRRQVRVGEVKFDLVIPPGAPLSQDELRARLNMLEPGARVSEQALKNNADLIQAYLRDHGFFRAEVDFSQQPAPNDLSGTRQTITYRIVLGEQARVSNFNIQIQGFDATPVLPALKLRPGAAFTREALGNDLARIRQAIIEQGYLAPQLDDEKVELEPSGTMIAINLTGGVGPRVEVSIAGDKLSQKEARALLPIEREGNIDESAIVEGERRLRNKQQQEGYFFAEVEASCAVAPPLASIETNNAPETCRSLNPTDLTGRTVTITYNIDRGRRFKLTDIRLEGAEGVLSIEDVTDELRTRKANALGFIPLLGYGRGYTSRELLEQDRRTIRARIRDLGYRRAEVPEIRQGVSLNGENLIITFVVNKGPLTRVDGIEIRGNKIYTDARLRNEIEDASRRRCAELTIEENPAACFRTVIGAAYSRSQARSDGDAILGLYARNGYIDAQLDFSTVELPATTLPGGAREEHVRLIYTIRNEGDKVFINQILVNGNVLTKKSAILRAIPLRPGEVLRADKLTESERILYATEAFRQVLIRTQNAGTTASGYRKRDVVIDVEEYRPRDLTYGGGYSTDNGPLGFINLRNINLFGDLRQGAVRLRASRRQQLLRFEYFDPRFRQYGTKRFAPLAISLEYQRDSTITRFFRSTIDSGNFGIVQRLDENGQPIDEFGMPAGEPTINRLTFNIETQRDFELKLGPRGQQLKRSTLFLRYMYEDVRLFNIDSLLIAPLLRPDSNVRLSQLGAAFVRDTRDSQFDSTRGQYLTLDYVLALRQLGGNISFSKFQTNYRAYYRLDNFRRTVLAGSLTLGLANLFNPRDRDGDGLIKEEDLRLPISERFFAGGSTTLRGFGFEEAGPREVIPGGFFRNSKGEPVALDAFTVPIGGNALAVVNLEARVPLTKIFQAVPFYDGGNVFRRVGEIFGRQEPLSPGDDPVLSQNLRAKWTHTVGLGVRIKTPIGGALAVDYGFLLNPPEFIIPQGQDAMGNDFPPGIFRLKRSQLHFRFTQTF
jgi:outer membrane protein insertion porin family